MSTPDAVVLPEDAQSDWAILQRNCAYLKEAATYCVENFGTRLCILEAEMARLSGADDGRITDYYDQAIVLCHRYQLPHLEALAAKLAAHYHFAQPRLGRETVQPIQVSLDWITVLKASQALSSEIAFSSLMEKLMRILIENAGAQRGLLVNRHPMIHQFAIDAIGRVDRDQINISVHETDSMREPQFPLSLITYVERTHQTIVLDHALQDDQFGTDPYVQYYGTKSVLCFPILSQGKLSSILYLENNLAGVTHEIKNPLNFISCNLDYAKRHTLQLLDLAALYQVHYPNPVSAIKAQMDLPFLSQDLGKLLQSMELGTDRIQNLVSAITL